MLNYIVKRGDTLSELARRNGTTVKALMQANGITDANRIVAGKTLTMTGDRLELSHAAPKAAPAKPVPAHKPAAQPVKPIPVHTPAVAPVKPMPAHTPTAQPVKPAPTPKAPESEKAGPAASCKPVVSCSRWNRVWSENDVEMLARAIAAEARSLVAKFVSKGDELARKAALASGYVIARTAAERKSSIEGLLTGQTFFLSSWGNGDSKGNASNFAQFFLPTDRIANWSELEKIAREALSGEDPTGVDPNHFYDDSIQAPTWAQRAGAATQLGPMVFVNSTPR